MSTMSAHISDLASRLSALPPSAFVLNAVTWVLLNVLTVTPMFNVQARASRLRWFWAYSAVQAFYLYKLGDVHTFVALRGFPGFLIIKFFMHVSYVVLVEDLCCARADGSWDFFRAYNIVSDPRGVGKEAKLKMRKVEHDVEVKEEVDVAGTATGYSTGGLPIRARGAGQVRSSAYSGFSSAGAGFPAVSTPEEKSDPFLDTPDTPFLQVTDFTSVYQTLSTSYHTLSPSAQFFLSRAAHLVLLHAIINCMDYFEGMIFQAWVHPSDYSPEKIHLLSRLGSVTPREILFRAYIAATFIGYPCLAMAKYHTILALAHVNVLRWSAPSEWPWLFGPLTESTSQRAFWSGFWHRLFAAPAVKWARWAAEKMGLRKAKGERGGIVGGLVYPLFLTFSIFAASGAMHSVVQSRFVDCGYDADFWEPMLNWAGIVLEGAFQFAVERGFVKRFWERHPGWYRGCGYAWTAAFFVCEPIIYR